LVRKRSKVDWTGFEPAYPGCPALFQPPDALPI
jgi:hypothetical protein